MAFRKFARPYRRRRTGRFAAITVLAALPVAGLCLLLGELKDDGITYVGPLPLNEPVRAEPERFPANTHLPRQREGRVSGSIDMATFSPGRDLVFVEDSRVWWESEHDNGDEEDDHTIHRAAETALRRLIELTSREGATLKVQDAYRPAGIHNTRSLHREGRAVDVTCEGLSLERLAKLCWAAGFDWVYHEVNSKNGAHVHCSVKRQPGE